MTAAAGSRKALGLAVVATMGSAAAAMNVPISMLLSESLQQSLPALYQSPLQAVQFSPAAVSLRETSTTLAHVVQQQLQQQSSVSLCFVVRRPG